MRRWRMLVVVVLSLAPLGGCDCKDSTGIQFVTIRGQVYNVDTLMPAEGVRVSLLDTGYADAVATDMNGNYVIKIPKGTVLALVTDDFNSMNDDWFPLINFDGPPVTATANIDNWQIHACPRTAPPQVGSVAIWDNYLANADDQSNGDLFEPPSCALSGGVISYLFVECRGGTLLFSDSMAVSIPTQGFPIGFVRKEWFATKDPTLGPACVYPGSRTVTDSCGWMVSFGDTAVAARSATVNVAEGRVSRGLSYPGSVEVPVRPGMITIVIEASIDGVPATIREVAMCAGLIP
jgi:hypothetical protein